MSEERRLLESYRQNFKIFVEMIAGVDNFLSVILNNINLDSHHHKEIIDLFQNWSEAGKRINRKAREEMKNAIKRNQIV